MDVTKLSNVAVAMQSALGTAQTITAISKANPGVLTYSGSDTFANGDIVLLTVQGMYQVDGRLFRVANVNTGADTFELEGENTTSYDTFTSGTLEEVTFGTTINSITDLGVSGGDFDFIDVTTIHDNIKKQIPGTANPITFQGSTIWDPADAGNIAFKTASDNSAKRAFYFLFSGTRKLYFNGYVGYTGLPTGNAQDKAVSPLSITMFGRPTTYTS